MPSLEDRRGGRLGSCALRLALIAALGIATPGCTLTRVSVGSPLELEALAQLVPGEAHKGQVLRVLGAPDGIVRQLDGDIFVYRHVRRNQATFRIEEPVFTGFELFRYTRSDQRHDAIVVLFDAAGKVREIGTAQGTDQLGAF